MKRLQIKLPVTNVCPDGWDSSELEVEKIFSLEEDGDAKSGFFDSLYLDSCGRFYLAATIWNAPVKDLRDLPFSAFRQVDTLTAFRWLVDSYQRLDNGDFNGTSGTPTELLESVLEMFYGRTMARQIIPNFRDVFADN